MALHDGFPSASGVADALDLRLGFAGLIIRDAAGVPRTGILPRHTNALVTPTATMNSAVAAFEGVVGRSGQGVVLLPNDGVVNVLHPNAPVANSRYDIVYAKQNDSVSPNADANSLPVLGVLALGASGSPTLPTYASAKAALDAAPSVLPGAEPLEAVLVPSTAITMQSAGVAYTALHRFTAAAGGVIIFRTAQERDAYLPVDGQRCFVLTEHEEYVYLNSTLGWSLARTPFKSAQAFANATSSPVATSYAPLPAPAPVSLTVDVARACLALITFRCAATVAAGFMDIGVGVSGATTLLPTETATGVAPLGAVLDLGPGSLVPASVTKLVALNAGSNTFTVQALIGGAGGAKTISNPYLIVSPA